MTSGATQTERRPSASGRARRREGGRVACVRAPGNIVMFETLTACQHYYGRVHQSAASSQCKPTDCLSGGSPRARSAREFLTHQSAPVTSRRDHQQGRSLARSLTHLRKRARTHPRADALERVSKFSARRGAQRVTTVSDVLQTSFVSSSVYLGAEPYGLLADLTWGHVRGKGKLQISSGRPEIRFRGRRVWSTRRPIAGIQHLIDTLRRATTQQIQTARISPHRN